MSVLPLGFVLQPPAFGLCASTQPAPKSVYEVNEPVMTMSPLRRSRSTSLTWARSARAQRAVPSAARCTMAAFAKPANPMHNGKLDGGCASPAADCGGTHLLLSDAGPAFPQPYCVATNVASPAPSTATWRPIWMLGLPKPFHHCGTPPL